MIRTNRLTALAMAGLIILATVGLSAPMTAADSHTDTGEDSVVDALFHDSDEDGDTGGWTTILAFWNGKVQKYNPLAEQPEQADAQQYAQDTRETFNQNAGALMNWTNHRVTADEDADVIRFKFTDESGNSAWLFVVTDVNTTTATYENARALNLTAFKQTDREVDLTYRLTPYASRNANAELDTFITEFASPGKDVLGTDAGEQYLTELAGEYQGEISGDDLPGVDR